MAEKLFKKMGDAEKQRLAYNKISKEYNWVQNKTFIGKLKKFNYDKVKNYIIKGSILDIGTGNGDFFKKIKNTERSIKAFDISEELIKIAKKKYKRKKIFFFNANIENLKLNQKFNNIISINVLHRVNTSKFKNLIYNCSNKKSVIIIVTMNLYSPQFILIRFIQIFLGLFNYEFGAQAANKGFSTTQIKKIFKNFKIIKVENNGYFHNFLRLECDNKLAKIITYMDNIICKIPIINFFGVSKLIVLKKN